jgi:hypothetical protein
MTTIYASCLSDELVTHQREGLLDTSYETSFILSHMVSRWLCINSSSLYPLTSIRLVVLNRLILYNCLFDLKPSGNHMR